MHDSMPEPTQITPLLVECDFLQDRGAKAIHAVVGSQSPGGGIIKAIIVDTWVSETSVDPSLSVMAMLDYGDGHYKSENIGKLLCSQEMIDATMSIIAESSEIQTSMEYLTEKLPLKNISQYIRCYFIGSTVVVSMEYLEGWLSTIGDDVLEYPDATANRSQICTYALPFKKSAHEKIEQLATAKQEWASFKGAWPTILGDEFAEKLDIEDPDFTTYPTAP